MNTPETEESPTPTQAAPAAAAGPKPKASIKAPDTPAAPAWQVHYRASSAGSGRSTSSEDRSCRRSDYAEHNHDSVPAPLPFIRQHSE